MTKLPRILVAGLAAVTVACSASYNDADEVTWTLNETLVIGSGDEGPTSFSWIKGVAVDESGRIFIYEHSTQDIRVFGADGDYIKTIGRKGAGPGELGNAEGIIFAHDGKLWVRDAANARYSVFSSEGEFLTAWTNTFCTSQGTWAPVVAEDRIVDEDCIPVPGEAHRYHILGYRTDMSRVDDLGQRAECGTRELAESAVWITEHANGRTFRQIPFAPRGLHLVTADGFTWCLPNSANYELLRIGQQGDTVRINRPVASLPVSSSERDSIIDQIESRGPTGVDFSRLPATKPAVERITLDDVGRLWVRRTASDGVVFDVLGQEGEYQATVRLGNYRSSLFSPFRIKGETVYMVTLDEDDVPQLRRFSIVKG